ncbi:MAG: hypothetical protein WCV91_04425 [Candidatus Margulisiibacteriota bacterium]
MNILFGSPKDELAGFLRNAGYNILGKKLKEPVVSGIDGKEYHNFIAAPYTVQKGKKKFVVVEMEIGVELDLQEEGLRNKLICLDRVFGLDGVLLADPKNRITREITFKFPKERGLDFYFQFLMALFFILGVIGIIWLLVSIKLF